MSGQLSFSKNPTIAMDPETCLLIYDRKLLRMSPELSRWISRFPFRYGVVSGERLKNLDQFPDHVRKLARISEQIPPKQLTVLALGGGSVGDFAGFFASVYKRGVRLVQVPTTWLAAIDSSHGGKTALNVGGAKNQIGSFYPAEKVCLIRSFLTTQPKARIQDAFGELAKIAIIDGGAWTKKLRASRLQSDELLWKFLKPAVEAKLKVVARDPKEISGHRQLLNLGHTIGHVLEAAHGISHGEAVALGLFFALDYSEVRGEIGKLEAEKIREFLSSLGIRRRSLRPIPTRQFQSLLLRDKKISSRDRVSFVFIQRFGRVIRQSVPVSEVLKEARRQGWMR